MKGVGVVGLKPVLIEPNLTHNSDAAPNYKYIFGTDRVNYLICETSQRNTYNQNHCDETKQRAQWRSETKTQENHKQDHGEPDHRH